MIGEARLKQLHDFIVGYSTEELIWINGYLSAIVKNSKAGLNGHTDLPSVNGVEVRKISLVYGTETGNSRKLATHLAAIAKSKGIHTKLVALDQYRLNDLSKEEYFFVVISTQGEGEPPIPARNFYDHIHQNNLSLQNLKFSVLALGDSSYPLFCKTGEEVDTQLNLFGAKRIVPLQKCDVDYEEEAMEWFEKVITVLQNSKEVTASDIPKPANKKTTGKKHYKGSVISNVNLNDRGSGKQTYHIEIGTEEAIDYEPGDSIGIVPANREEDVKKILSITGIDKNLIVQTPRVTATAEALLSRHLGICYLLSSTVKKYAAITGENIPETRMNLFDLLSIYPLKDPSQFVEVLKILMPVSPRLYSVSSSPAAHGDNEVHITVARNQFLSENKTQVGLCSEFLGDQPVGSTINFYIHKSRNFKLPAPDKPVIMIGPGTGIAPFRSFLAERDATGATGKNWFFFGEQHFTTDFLYQTEIQQFVLTGVLTKIDLAFSRDQPQKIYVQHRLKQKATEIIEWLDAGAYIYISGTKDPMSKDVDNSLLEILQEKGGKTAEEATLYIKKLKEEGRYEKDVY